MLNSLAGHVSIGALCDAAALLAPSHRVISIGVLLAGGARGVLQWFVKGGVCLFVCPSHLSSSDEGSTDALPGVLVAGGCLGAGAGLAVREPKVLRLAPGEKLHPKFMTFGVLGWSMFSGDLHLMYSE